MAGDVSTLRTAGLPAGYPAEIDASVKIRWVDNLLINMSEMSTDMLKYLGGPSQFTFTNPKVEWVEDDQWGRRPTHGGLAAAGTTSWTVTGQGHRYPIGTLFKHIADGEIVRNIGIIDDNTLLLQRDVPGTVAEGAWVSTDEVIVVGHSMSEDDSWTFRPSAILTLPFNYAQVTHVGIQATYRRVATALYGLQGTDLDYQSAAAVAQEFVAMEQSLVDGVRYVGANQNRPAMTGGIAYYVTSANGAEVADLSSAPITRKDIDDRLQNLWYSVGPENMARTLAYGAWTQRKIDGFFANNERLPAGFNGTPGVSITSMRTAFGVIDLMMHTAVGKSDLWFINRDKVKMGNFAGLGRPHLLALAAPSATGPRIQRAFYGDIGVMVKGVQSMGRIQNISTSS